MRAFLRIDARPLLILAATCFLLFIQPCAQSSCAQLIAEGSGGPKRPDHGQWINGIEVIEHVAWVRAVGEEGNRHLVAIGNCAFVRANRFDDEWESAVEAYPGPVPLKDPWFEYEKFPTTLKKEFEKGTSSAHPVRTRLKDLVGVAKFYFRPKTPIGFSNDLLASMLPKDIFDMSFSSEQASCSYYKNRSEIIHPDFLEDFTAYTLMVRVDGPNDVTRHEAIRIGIDYRLSIYAKKGDKWLGPMDYAIPRNQVTYATIDLALPHSLAINGQYEIRGVLEQRFLMPLLPGMPGFPGTYWTDWTKLEHSDEFTTKLFQYFGRNN